MNRFLLFREKENDQRSGMGERVGKSVGMGASRFVGSTDWS